MPKEHCSALSERRGPVCPSLGGKQVFLRQDRMHGVEFEVLKQPAQALRTSAQVEIVPKTRQGSRMVDARLIGIDLPRMDIENDLLLLLVQPAQRPAREPIRKKPKVS